MIFPHAAAAAAKENCLFRVTFVVVWAGACVVVVFYFPSFFPRLVSCSTAFVVVSSLFRLFALLAAFLLLYFAGREKPPFV